MTQPVLLSMTKKLLIVKDKGRVKNLEKTIKKTVKSKFAFAHTRWATHGEPSKKCAST